MGYGERLNP